MSYEIRKHVVPHNARHLILYVCFVEVWTIPEMNYFCTILVVVSWVAVFGKAAVRITTGRETGSHPERCGSWLMRGSVKIIKLGGANTKYIRTRKATQFHASRLQAFLRGLTLCTSEKEISSFVKRKLVISCSPFLLFT